MISLPDKTTITLVKSFWIVFCALLLSVITFLLAYFFNSILYLLILCLIPAFVNAGYMNPKFISKMYAFFKRVIGKIVRVVRNLILLIIYYVFLFSFKGSEDKNYFFSNSPAHSFWAIKNIEMSGGQDMNNYVVRENPNPSMSLFPFIYWVYKTGKWKFLPLIPLLFIVSALTSSGEKSKISADTYTLF